MASYGGLWLVRPNTVGFGAAQSPHECRAVARPSPIQQRDCWGACLCKLKLGQLTHSRSYLAIPGPCSDRVCLHCPVNYGERAKNLLVSGVFGLIELLFCIAVGCGGTPCQARVPVLQTRPTDDAGRLKGRAECKPALLSNKCWNVVRAKTA